jgi:5-formyltetrahydrofolate cyclo-ligase
LGYGAGYYDRTLAALRSRGRVTAIGLAFAEQEMAALPHDARDQRLDWVVTQAGARPIEG